MGRPPGEVTLRPAFLALRLLTRDYSVSMGLARPDLGWEAKADGTPALGAIPTLKWVDGLAVADRRAVPLARRACGRRRAPMLAVYDALRSSP